MKIIFSNTAYANSKPSPGTFVSGNKAIKSTELPEGLPENEQAFLYNKEKAFEYIPGLYISPLFEDEKKSSSAILKSSIAQELKNEDLLYQLYSGQQIEILNDALNDESFMAEMYKDVDFMKASNAALKKVVDDKLINEELTEQDKMELLTLHNLFSMQEDMFNNPLNSFEIGLSPKLNNDRINKFSASSKNQGFQPAFGSIFNYGFFNKPKTPRQKAEAIVNRAASAAAAESAFLLTFGTPDMEVAALSATTIAMCRKICEAYKMPGGAISSLVARITGQLAGKTLADYGKNIVGKFFPGVGNAVNASITYTLHQMQGRSIIAWCEANCNNPNIANWDTAAKTFNIFRRANERIGNPVDDYIEGFGSEEGLSDFIDNNR